MAPTNPSSCLLLLLLPFLITAPRPQPGHLGHHRDLPRGRGVDRADRSVQTDDAQQLRGDHSRLPSGNRGVHASQWGRGG
ncbi:hypothetical protein PBY51_001381 [Eleginops maclovinus]|uniref:Uncharacterized protein n=1 Tax=Eleginops maclovinus TaxID=56733 RepID=A0AAN7WVY6_ELEMC|nr:hypothetical protein PBY51_001381 [Eleginops maclovinus]